MKPINTHKPRQSSGGLKIGRLLLGIIAVFVAGLVRYSQPVSIHQQITVREGQTPSIIFDELGPLDKIKLKLHLHQNPDALKPLQTGTYTFSGDYKKTDLIQIINNGPQVSYESVTVLEGRSIYDVDYSLTKKWLINAGEYIDFVSDQDIITTYTERYDFLAQVRTNLGEIPPTLEGFLYPETYFLDTSKDIIDQLVYLQLESFQTQIRSKLASDIVGYPKVHDQNRETDLSRYSIITLASVIQKEERTEQNKPIIAGLFMNRLDKGMRIDADITLCYGLFEPYETCPPSVIVANLNDTENRYNTRVHSGLPPTPISSITTVAVDAVLNPEPSNFIYYLHAPNGQIHFGETIADHNNNKIKYLNN